MRFRLPKTCAVLLLVVAAGCGSPAAGPDLWRTKVAPWQVEVEDASVRVDPQVVTIGPDDVWVFGGRGPADTTRWPVARHWNGRSWSKVDLPGGRSGAILAAGASSASDVWAVTSGEPDSAVLHWDGARWTVAQRLPGFTVTTMEVFSPQDVRVYGSGPSATGTVWSRTAEGWSRSGLPFLISRTSARSARDIWALTFEEKLYRYDGTVWKAVPLDGVLPAGKTHHLMEITTTDTGIWITAEGGGSPFRGGPPQSGSPQGEPGGPDLTSLLVHGDPEGGRWTAESLMDRTGRLNEFAAPIIDPDGGVWLIGSTDVNAYDSALAHRTPDGAWTRTRIRAPRFGFFEVRAFARMPGGTRFLVAGMNDEDGAILSTR
ncbi:hypothetical protein [Actinomadura formosensis]|uniref:hypothetical protein n=1 Tax=Actinomadura formosensis TaxID=60706 RepID=UPI003D8B014F